MRKNLINIIFFLISANALFSSDIDFDKEKLFLDLSTRSSSFLNVLLPKIEMGFSVSMLQYSSKISYKNTDLNFFIQAVWYLDGYHIYDRNKKIFDIFLNSY